MKVNTKILGEIIKLVLCASIIFNFQFSIFNYANAQHVIRHHRCWDIDIIPEAQEYPLLSSFHHPAAPEPCITVVDTGSLIVDMAKQYIGTPYRYGGRTPKGFDCAGFALFLYRHFGHSLPGWSGAQYRLGDTIDDTRLLLPGDLVFFGGRGKTNTVGHTGIVVDTNAETGVFRFIHASTGAGVIISRSTEEYYKKRYIGARRILKS